MTQIFRNKVDAEAFFQEGNQFQRRKRIKHPVFLKVGVIAQIIGAFTRQQVFQNELPDDLAYLVHVGLLARRTHRPRPRAMMFRWISEVPEYRVLPIESRRSRSTCMSVV